MKAAFALLLAVICAGAGGAARGPAGASPGGDYRSLGDWARANGFEARWLKRDQTVELSGRAARLVFGVEAHDLREAVINGAGVYLSRPVVMRGGSAWISGLDLNTAINPVLHPPRNTGGTRVRTIVLDPGHGGKDPGNQDGPHQEKTYTLLLAQELAGQLQRAGFKVSLTRTTDTLIDLPARPEIARQRGADLFISLHWNAVQAGRGDVKGVEVYCLTPAGVPSTNAGGEGGDAGAKPGNLRDQQNMLLAWELQKSLVKDLAAEDRSVHRARFAVLRTAVMPAVLIEGGYMSHPDESRRIYDPAYRQQMARAIVEGVLGTRRRWSGPDRLARAARGENRTSVAVQMDWSKVTCEVRR